MADDSLEVCDSSGSEIDDIPQEQTIQQSPWLNETLKLDSVDTDMAMFPEMDWEKLFHSNEEASALQYEDDYYATYNMTQRARILEHQKKKSSRRKDEKGTKPANPRIVQNKKPWHVPYTLPIAIGFESSADDNEDADEKESTEEGCEYTKKTMKHRKRSINLLRESERDLKRDFTDFSIVPSVISQVEDDGSGESAAKMLFVNAVTSVATCKRFRCLTSKPVCMKESEFDPATGTKIQVECPSDRMDFYRRFSKVVRLGNPDKENNYGRQFSEQDQMWQNEIKDLIWLELSAWHVDKLVTEHDLDLCLARQNDVANIFSIIENYRFVPPTPSTSALSEQCDITSTESKNGDEKTEDHRYNKKRASGPSRSDSAIGSDEDGSFIGVRVDKNPFVFENNQNTYSNILHKECFSVFCQECIRHQNAALLEVEQLLSQIEYVEGLYPSNRALYCEHVEFQDLIYISHVETLCMWFNLTTQLRLRIDILGKLIIALGGRNCPWPRWEDKPLSPQILETSIPEEVVVPENTLNEHRLSVNDIKFHRTQPAKGKVQFSSLYDKDTGSTIELYNTNTTPTDSNNSTDSNTTSDTSSGISQISAPSSNSEREHFDSTCVDGAIYDLAPYRKYVEKYLKTGALKKMLVTLERLFMPILLKARKALEEPNVEDLKKECETPEGIWNGIDVSSESQRPSQCPDLGLPSFKAAYLFLCRIPLDVIHECLRMRLEQKPAMPSQLSIRQLMRECKEALKAAVMERSTYMYLTRTALKNVSSVTLAKFVDEITEFDKNVTSMLEAYLDYLHQWIRMIQQDASLICDYQKNILEEEWSFVKTTCPHIPSGETLAGVTFCEVTSRSFENITRLIGTVVDSCSVDSPTSQFEVDGEPTFKQTMLKMCRDYQSIFHDGRMPALKTVAFAKTLRKDLEIAAEFSFDVDKQTLLDQLSSSGHIRVIAPHSTNHLIFVPGEMRNEPRLICQMLDMRCCHDESQLPELFAKEGTNYLVLLNCESCLQFNKWNGDILTIQPVNAATSSLSQVEVDGLMLIVSNAAQLGFQRRLFQLTMGDMLSLTREHCPSKKLMTKAVEELKTKALMLRDQIVESIHKIEENLDIRDVENIDEMDRPAILSRCRETLHQCYKFGFEYQKEVGRLLTGDAKKKWAKGLLSFAKQWMTFATERCERGRGLRPRWASHGFQFLILVSDPHITINLTQEAFSDLTSSIDACVSHVVGSVDNRTPHSGRTSSTHSRASSPSPNNRRPLFSSRSTQDGTCTPPDISGGKNMFPHFPRSELGEPGSSPLIRRRGNSQSIVPFCKEEAECGVLAETLQIPSISGGSFANHNMPVSRMERVKSALSALESERETTLKEERLIGEVTADSKQVDRVYIRARSVTFSWQRGIKIGQGHFGKVYTAVNNQTGELMAMKEIQLQPNDHRTIKTIYEEIKIFEGIQNKHVVRHFGVEVHREEMLIFMEYCEEGTLENLVASTENGLPEQLIRQYTGQLLTAIALLHGHGIVHRDIKSANIFLTSEGNCLKLGDFGCAVKIKTQTTMPGELQGFVGTQAYMAPEVFTKNLAEGHGRAADMWSIGCVVLEMASGKRPWHELESNYQIMFKVGMGERPLTPDNLSDEGQDFLDACLNHDPRKRATASELLGHNFVKVDVDDGSYMSLPIVSHYESSS